MVVRLPDLWTGVSDETRSLSRKNERMSTVSTHASSGPSVWLVLWFHTPLDVQSFRRRITVFSEYGTRAGRAHGLGATAGRRAGRPGGEELAARMELGGAAAPRVYRRRAGVLALRGPATAVAKLHDPTVIRKILSHLSRAPSRRAPVPPRPRPAPPRPELILASAAAAVGPGPRGVCCADLAGRRRWCAGIGCRPTGPAFLRPQGGC